MRARILPLLALCLLLATDAAAGRMYWRSALTGSGPGALDAISKTAATPGVPLTAGDGAVVVASQVYYFTFDATSQAPEASPAVIAPDDGGATGRWLRVPAFLLANDVAGLATVATSGSYNDLTGKPTLHAHANLAAINAVTDAGSGEIITSQERTNLGTAYSHSQAAHAPALAEENVNADWAAAPGSDAYIQNKPAIPTTTSELTNTSGYLTSFTETDPWVNALGRATLACSTGQLAKYNGTTWACAADLDTNTDVQWSGTATGLDAAAGRASLGLATIATSGSYGDLSNKPAIPTTTSALTNDSGFLTSFTETDPGVNALGRATLACSTGQLAKYNGTTWACGADLDTDTDILWSGTATGLNAATGRAALGLGTAAVVNTGTGASNVILGSDSRLTDARTPTAHTQAWSTITTTPTTSAGYGITDGGDMLKSVYDANTDNKIDDAAIATTIARTSAIPNLAAPGPIGGTTAAAGAFTALTAQSLTLGPLPAGTTGELSLPEDPGSPGDNTVGWKAPASIPATVKWVLPSVDGTSGQMLITNGAAQTSWSSVAAISLASPGPIGSTTPNTIKGTDITANSFIANPGANGTTETIALREDPASPGGNKFTFKADTSIAADVQVLVPSQLPIYVTPCPTLATGTCTTGQQCLSTTYWYLCVAANTWRRAAVAAW